MSSSERRRPGRWLVALGLLLAALPLAAQQIKIATVAPDGSAWMREMRAAAKQAEAATEGALMSGDLHGVRVRLIADAGAALMALLVATGLSVFKPRGLTAYGRRRQLSLSGVSPAVLPASPRTLRGLYIAALVLVLTLFVLLHLFMGGHGGH